MEGRNSQSQGTTKWPSEDENSYPVPRRSPATTEYEDSFAVGTIHNGEISEIVDKGATVEFGEDIVAFIPTRHLEKEDGKKLKKGDTAEFKVIEFNKEFKRVVASHTAIFREEEEKNVKTATENTSSNSSNTNAPAATLGDNNDVLAALKAKMEKSEKK